MYQCMRVMRRTASKLSFVIQIFIHQKLASGSKCWALAAAALTLGACAASQPNGDDVHNYGTPPQINARYFDGACTSTELIELQRMPNVMHPEMVAIGDSLYNGVRSLRVNWWLAENSAPTMIAISLGLINVDDRWNRTGARKFNVPLYPGHPSLGDAPNTEINLGLDLEGLRFSELNGYIRDEIKILLAVRSREHLNAAGNARIGHPFSDNLAYSGADAFDLLNLSHAQTEEFLEYKSVVDGASIADGLRSGNGVNQLGEAFFYINSGFVLNPLGLDCLRGMTAIEQVELRQPKRVIVNIGSNHGVYRIAFNGVPIDAPYCKREAPSIFKQRSIAAELQQQYLANMKDLVSRLSLVPGLEHVYINAVPRPSFAANLVPTEGADRIDDNYFSDYVTAFSFGPASRLTGEQVRAADELVESVNRRVSDLLVQSNRLANAPKFEFVDINAELLDNYDSKRKLSDASAIKVYLDRYFLWFVPGDHEYKLTNKPLAVGPWRRIDLGRLWVGVPAYQGGIFSLDNMHLSSVGYSKMAQHIQERISKSEKIAPAQYGRSLVEPQSVFSLKSNRKWEFLRGGDGLQSFRQEIVDLATDFLIKNEPDECTRFTSKTVAYMN